MLSYTFINSHSQVSDPGPFCLVMSRWGGGGVTEPLLSAQVKADFKNQLNCQLPNK